MKRILLLMLLVMLLPVKMLGSGQQSATLRQQMGWLHQEKHVNFVYDASLNVGLPYKGPSLKGLPTGKALKTLFEGTNIKYKVEGKYVMLFKQAAPAPQSPDLKYTLSGFVRDSIGETMVNATIFDLTTGQGTMTNEHGYYSLTLPKGSHLLRVSFVGYAEQMQRIDLNRSQALNITLNGNASLGEVVVTGDLNSPVTGTQMGKRSLTQADIKTEFSLLSSPDVVKTLQRMSGVQEGVELASGLYVHGGNNDENLFLIDGTPLYAINHTLGLFSAFNTDMVKNVDFYKSGFPARYGGRLSSVIDVRSNDGNMQAWHGSYRIGLLDGSVHFEGPIQKGKTSLNVGLRRSWLDLLTEPVFFAQRQISKEEKVGLNYNFHDLNAKVTHIVSDRSKLSLSIYSGGDALTTKYDADWDYDDETHTDLELTKNRLRWGNLNAALNWNLLLSPKLQSNFTAVYTHNRANIFRLDDYQYGRTDNMTISHNEHETRSTIDDIGYRAAFDFRPAPNHHIRFGHDYTLHLFSPQTKRKLSYFNDEAGDTVSSASKNRHTSHEFCLYGEDQITLSDHWSLNAGLNLSAFGISGKTFFSADPRMALKYQLTTGIALKASYTMMTQYVHKITNSFLEMPTDYWVPTTASLKPMHSHQWAAGIYAQVNRHWMVSMEGYYKSTRHLLQYQSWTGLEPPAASWDTEVMDGDGKFYGLELDAQYRSKRVSLEGTYTLSWNKRKFNDFYEGWYYDKFDNRHKLNLTGRFKLSKKTEMYAAWTYHTGNKMTMPTQYVCLPQTPTIQPPYQQTIIDYDSDANRKEFIYEHPNNITLPAYHRLDIGFNFFHTTKHGHQRIWNLSLYNAYCHLNTMWTEVDLVDGKFRIKSKGYIPIVPSFSYTIKF